MQQNWGWFAEICIYEDNISSIKRRHPDNQSICFQPQLMPSSSEWNKHALGLSFHSQKKSRFCQRHFLECSWSSETSPNKCNSSMSYTSFYH